MSSIPKPKQPQPLPRGGGWRLTPEELEALRNAPPSPPPKAAKKKPPRKLKNPPPPTMADYLASHIKKMRESSELKLDRISAYRLALAPSAQRELLRESVRMRNSVAIMSLYATADSPTLATLDTLESAIFTREKELERLKEKRLSSTARECDSYDERIAFLQCEIATYSLVLEYARKTLKE